MLRIIQGRLATYIEREIPEGQACFRKGGGTRDQIANTRWILERAIEYGKTIFMCFIDYSKAFDCVDHSRLWSARAPYSRGVFRPRQTRQLPRTVDLKRRILSCQSY